MKQKMMKQRIVAFALVLCMIFNMVSIQVSAKSVSNISEELSVGKISDIVEVSSEEITQIVKETETEEETENAAETTQEESVEETTEGEEAAATETSEIESETHFESEAENETETDMGTEAEIETETDFTSETESEPATEETQTEPEEETEEPVTEITTEEAVVEDVELMADTIDEAGMTSIVLSNSSIKINRATTSYLKKELSVTNLPEGEAPKFVWSSSDTTIATVTQDGVVTGIKDGKAIITVALAQNPAVYANCEFEMRCYGLKIGLYDMDHVWDGVVDLYIGGSSERIQFLDRTNREKELENYTVTIEKEHILSYESNALYAKEAGETKVYFEKDGFVAELMVYVTVSGEAFGITGFEASDTKYPSISQADGSYVLAKAEGVTYCAQGEITPYQEFGRREFNWSIADTSIATVDSAGVVTPIKAGKTTLTVVPRKYRGLKPYLQEKVEIELEIRELPETVPEEIYALTNVCKKLGDVELPSGWEWKYPDTELITNTINREGKVFVVVSNDPQKYPRTEKITVHVGKITGLELVSQRRKYEYIAGINSKGLQYTIDVKGEGAYSNAEYTTEIPDVKGLKITKTDGVYHITAEKIGTYTIKPVIKAGDTVIAKTVKKVQFVNSDQVETIEFFSDTEGVTIERYKKVFASLEEAKDFVLRANLVRIAGDKIDTELQWSTTDKNVATVKTVPGKNTLSAKVTIKGPGRAKIIVTTTDAYKYRQEFIIEVQDHAPRVTNNKVVVNMAYDYSVQSGKRFASEKGGLEIFPAYNEKISAVKIYDKTGTEEDTDFSAAYYLAGNGSSIYVVQPVSDTIKVKKKNCTLRVTMSTGESYDYPLSVTVVNQNAAISVKTTQVVNTFNKKGKGELAIKVPEQVENATVTWEDESEGDDNGFAISASSSKKNNKGELVFLIEQQAGLQLKNGKLADSTVGKGTFTVIIKGYQPFVFKNFKIKNNYKKPVIVTKTDYTAYLPEFGETTKNISLYNKTDKAAFDFGSTPAKYYTLTCNNENVICGKMSYDDDYFACKYTGNKDTTKVTFTLNFVNWREPITFSHTLKIIKPKVYVKTPQVTYNKQNRSDIYVGLGVKNLNLAYKYADIKGCNEKSQKLLDEHLLVTECPAWANSNWNNIKLSLSNDSLINSKISTGTYKYKVTPYYQNVETKEKIALNTVTFSVKVIDKTVTAKITTKGSLDITRGEYVNKSKKTNLLVMNETFQNLSSSVKKRQLVGEYSEYFTLTTLTDPEYRAYGFRYYIRIADGAAQKLRAGQKYKLAIQYSLNNGQTVISSTFTITPKQTKPKVTVKNNNQTMCLANDDYIASFDLSFDYGWIKNAYGGVDCDGDGKLDINIYNVDSDTLYAKIDDKAAIGATAKGKIYTIPVTLELNNRDGVSEDTTVMIKLKIVK